MQARLCLKYTMEQYRRLMLCIIVIFAFGLISAQTKRALVIGISEYPQNCDYSWSAIHGTNDAELIVPILKEQGFKTTKVCNKDATAKRIRQEIAKLIELCGRGDIVYLHFSGHGQPFEDLDGDEDDGWDESIIPYDAQKVYVKGQYEGANHITDDELHSYFQKLMSKVGPSGLVCVVIDACHAGGTSRGEEDEEDTFLRGTKKGFSPNAKDYHPRINTKGSFQIAKKADQGDAIVLEACRSYQSNYEIKQNGKYYGPLSYYVGKVLAKQNLTANKSWIDDVNREMKARLTRQNMVYETTLK